MKVDMMGLWVRGKARWKQRIEEGRTVRAEGQLQWDVRGTASGEGTPWCAQGSSWDCQ